MRSLKFSIIILVTASLFGCLSTPRQGVGFYAFTFQGNSYEILSSFASDGDGGNMLVQRTDHKVIMRAVDYDQDRNIDRVIIGDISLNEANDIYNAGLNSAKLKTNYKKYIPKRILRMYTDAEKYILQTYILSQNEQFNKLVIIDKKTKNETVLYDNDSDGKLDQFDPDKKLYYEGLYSKILQAGMNMNKIEKKQGMYLVKLQ